MTVEVALKRASSAIGCKPSFHACLFDAEREPVDPPAVGDDGIQSQHFAQGADLDR